MVKENQNPINYRQDLTSNNLSTNSTSNTAIINNLQNRLYDNLSWDTTSPALQKIALLQGIPFTIFSYAAGIFRSNNRFNLYGLIDLFTYISRLNILGSINIRNDITFTFLNEKKILDGFLSTHDSGIYGSALNIFMNKLDFEIMDSILHKPASQIVSEQNNNKIYEISYNTISKIQPSSMISPDYFKKHETEEKIILDEQKIKDNKSIIFGGIDYEQISIILDNIPLFPNIEDKGFDSFCYDNYIFHYYIESNFDELKIIYQLFNEPDFKSWPTQANYDGNDDPTQIGFNGWNQFTESITENRELNSKFYIYESANRTLAERIKLLTTGKLDLCYNDIFPYFYKQVYGLEYNYGHIFFISKHPRVANIFLMKMDGVMENENYDYTHKNFTEKTINIYNYLYDDSKKNNNNVNLNIILMPVKIDGVDDGSIGTIDYQFNFEYNIRNSNTSIMKIEIGNYTESENDNKYPYEHSDTGFYQLRFVKDKIINNNFTKSPLTIHYTILCGLDDTLSYKYLENLKIYGKETTRFGISNIKNIVNKTYLCYYDGNNETFKKVLTSSNNTATLDFFNKIKKVINYNSNNSFQNLQSNKKNIIDEITSFVYNINEGKSFSLDIAKNNPLSYNSGLILGVDCIILIYITQIYYNDFTKIFSSSEIFTAYYNIINNNLGLYNDKLNKINQILNNKYSFLGTNIIDNESGSIYTSLSQLNLNDKDEFFIYVSEILKRNINTLNQKSFYKIIEYIPENYLDSDGNIKGIDIGERVKLDFTQIEDKWYDITHKSQDHFNSYVCNKNNNRYGDITIFYNYYNTLSFNGDEFDEFNLENRSIYESYILIRAYAKQLFNDYDSYGIIYKLFETYKKIKELNNQELLVGELMDELARMENNSNYIFARLSSNRFSLLFREYYIFNFFKNYSNNLFLSMENTSYSFEINYICYLKFLLLTILDKKSYYEYINYIIDDNQGYFTDSTFNYYIKLDYFPYYEFSTAYHSKALNFTFVDVFNKIKFNDLIDTFTYNNSKSIINIIRLIFIENITYYYSLDSNTINNLNQVNTRYLGFSQPLIPFMNFIINNFTKIQNFGLLLDELYLEDDDNQYIKKSILVLFKNIQTIYKNVNKNFDEIIDYENKYFSMTDSNRFNIFNEYKNYN